MSMYTESEQSEESEDGSTLRRMSPTTRENFRKKINIIVCLSSAITLIILNILGALLFLFIEKSNESINNFPENACISKNLKIGLEITMETRKNLENCLKSQTKIDSFEKAFFFSWTLYSTVGYGNFYPNTLIGRFFTATYSLLMIPIYIAFKFEFGTLLAEFLLKIANPIGKSIRNRFRCTPAHLSNMQRDRLIFGFSIFFCTISLFSSSIFFSKIEEINFWPSVYFGVITMSLIGLGDIVPMDLTWFLGYSLFFLVSDVLSNQIFYFCQARIRRAFHFVARRLLLLEKGENTVSLNHVPVINSQCMPAHVMNCEKEELNKDEGLLYTTPTGFRE